MNLKFSSLDVIQEKVGLNNLMLILFIIVGSKKQCEMIQNASNVTAMKSETDYISRKIIFNHSVFIIRNYKKLYISMSIYVGCLRQLAY